MELVVTVSVDIPDPPEVNVTLGGFNPVVRLVDEDVTAKVTVPAKPLRLVSAIVDVPEEPCTLVREVGLDEIVKSGTVTVTVTLVE